MKIQLINPPLLLNSLALTAHRPSPPLGLAYIAAALRTDGHRVSVIDAIGEAPEQFAPCGQFQQLGLTIEQIIARIDKDTQVIGITSIFSFIWAIVRLMICRIRENFPEIIIVCGGEHFTALPEFSMQNAPIDYIVMGEGEQVVSDLFAKLESGAAFNPNGIPGICWRQESAIVCNNRAPRIKKIDKIKWPAWDLFDLEVYNKYNYVTGNKLGKTVPILATRGCPYSCKFCSSKNMWTTRWYPRNPIDVVDEIEFYMRQYGAEHFPFQDLTPIIKREWVAAFCNEIINRGLKIRWQVAAGTRCEFVNEEILLLMKKSGCDTLYYAPESGAEETRISINKCMKTSNLMQAVDLTIKARLKLGVFLVLGFPDDTIRALRKTVKLVRKLALKGLIDISPAFYFPIPASALFNELSKKKRIQIDDSFLLTPIFMHNLWMTDENNYCQNISSLTLTFYKYWIVANFYIISWMTHPWRIVTLLYNVAVDKESSKMDTFLNMMKRKMLKKVINLKKWERTWKRTK